MLKKARLESRWWSMRRIAAMAALAMSAAACQMVIGIEDTTVVQPDAAPGSDARHDAAPGEPPSEYAVRGMAIGLSQPVSLQLMHEGGSERVSVPGDGAFAFEARLGKGASYSVSIVGTPPCVLEGESGTIDSEEPAVVLACAGAPLLTGLVLSGPRAPDVGVSLARSEYEVEMPLMQQNVSITPMTLRPEATVTIAGASLSSGTPSPALPLALGSNEIEIVVSHPSGLQRTYRVTIHRAAAVAQYVYGKASNTGTGDEFGHNVALSGDTLAVGAHYEDSAATGVRGDEANNSMPSSGAVYVFRRSGTTWTQEAYIKASNTGGGDYFGYSVALSGDTLAVGAYGEDSTSTGIGGNQADNSSMNSGAVYVFLRSGTSWAQQAYVKASNTEAGDEFGHSVALSGDTLAVSAHGEDSMATGVGGNQADNSAVNSGAVYVYRRSGTTWTQQAYVKASNTGTNDQFGMSVTLSGDTLAVGAPGEDSAATGIGGDQGSNTAGASGAVYVFRRSGTNWTQEAYVKASNTGGSDFFGASVALSGDTLAVAARHEDSAATGVGGNQTDNNAADSGAVYVFRRNDTTWAQEAYVKASNTDPDDRFGWSVGLSGDTLAVGAYNEDSAATGVGGNQADSSAVDSGAAYVFRRSGTNWAQQAYVKASNTGAEDQFGWSVALSGDTLAVGAHFEDSAATGIGGDEANDSASNSGAVYIFH